MKRFSTLIFLLTLLVACLPTPTATPTPLITPTVIAASPTPELPPAPWWREAVFYEIFVRSFYDTNGDGIGDFNGITQKLDYLESLGVNAIWLMPINTSPSYHGYDVIDYYAVNPQYGTLDDFKRLLSEAHGRDIRIIIDLVLNHTSSQHPWFVEAKSNPQSSHHNWYVWSDKDSGGGRWYQVSDEYYYAYFWSEMPDLNYDNPAVTAEMEKMSAFWLNDLGVDGFRVDAAKHLIEDGNKLENTPATHDWFKGFYDFYKAQNPQAYVVGEVSGAGGLIAKTYAGQMDQIFNFEMANAFVNSAAGGANSSANSAIKFALKDKPDGDYATFLTNHDQNRVMSVLNGDMEQAKVAASLLLTAPGTPFIYYGEEIGMSGKKPDEMIRTPMQWEATANAGFTNGTPWEPVNSDYSTVNVATQEKDNLSLLNHYQTLIQLRQEHSVLSTGSVALLETGNSGVYALLRYDDTQKILVLINLKNETISDYQLTLAEKVLQDGAYPLETLLGQANAHNLNVTNGKFQDFVPVETLLPYQTLVFRIQ